MSTESILTNNLDRKAELEHRRHLANIIKIIGEARILLLQGMLSQEEFNNISNKCGYRALTNESAKKYIDNTRYFRYRLIDLYSRIAKTYKNYRTGYIYFDKIEDDFGPEMVEFFKFINCYDLFHEIEDRGMILGVKNTKLCYCIDAGKLSYIVLTDPYDNQLKTPPVTIAHEMGHAFTYNTLANARKDTFAKNIENEIFSILFERMFFDFLLENGKSNPVVVKMMIRNLETLLLAITKRCKYVLDLIDTPDYDPRIEGLSLKYIQDNIVKSEDISKQNYAIGNIASAKLFTEYKKDREYFIRHLKDLVKRTHNMSFEEVITEYSDIPALEQHLDLTLTKRQKRSI